MTEPSIDTDAIDTTAVAAPDRTRLVGIFLAGALVSVALGIYGREHTPTFERPFSLFFTDTINLKVWFATAAMVLAIAQVLLAMRLYGKLRWPRMQPPWLGDLHRLLGTLAFLVTLPVAFLCLWSLGFQDGTTRALVHSLLGCFLYVAFVAKGRGGMPAFGGSLDDAEIRAVVEYTRNGLGS